MAFNYFNGHSLFYGQINAGKSRMFATMSKYFEKEKSLKDLIVLAVDDSALDTVTSLGHEYPYVVPVSEFLMRSNKLFAGRKAMEILANKTEETIKRCIQETGEPPIAMCLDTITVLTEHIEAYWNGLYLPEKDPDEKESEGPRVDTRAIWNQANGTHSTFALALATMAERYKMHLSILCHVKKSYVPDPNSKSDAQKHADAMSKATKRAFAVGDSLEEIKFEPEFHGQAKKIWTRQTSILAPIIFDQSSKKRIIHTRGGFGFEGRCKLDYLPNQISPDWREIKRLAEESSNKNPLMKGK